MSLRFYLENTPNIPWTSKIGILIDIAKAIIQLHTNNFIYSDLKPENILLTENLTCKLTDFGTAVQIVRTPSKAGSLWYMAPEVLQPQQGFDQKSDIYSFSIVMWEVFTQQKPYNNGKDFSDLNVCIKDLRPHMEWDKQEDIPDVIMDEAIPLMEVCWKQNPADREDFEFIIKKLMDIQERLQILNTRS